MSTSEEQGEEADAGLDGWRCRAASVTVIRGSRFGFWLGGGSFVLLVCCLVGFVCFFSPLLQNSSCLDPFVQREASWVSHVGAARSAWELAPCLSDT